MSILDADLSATRRRRLAALVFACCVSMCPAAELQFAAYKCTLEHQELWHGNLITVSNQGASGGAPTHEVGRHVPSKCSSDYWINWGDCGFARRRPHIQAAGRVHGPELEPTHAQLVCVALRSMHNFIHSAQVVWDGRVRQSFFPLYEREFGGFQPTPEFRRRSLMLMMPPIVSGECDDGFNLMQLGGEECEQEVCEGSKHICVPEWTEYENSSSCLIYSFGSHGDLSFERDVVSRWGGSCEVHIFDCFSVQDGETIEIFLHGRPAFLHGWCLDAVDDAGQWRVSFGSIGKRLGHHGRDIDLIQMDIEGWEWYFFEQLVPWSQETAAVVHQISFELHTHIPGTFPEVQLGSLDHAQLFALLYRLGYHFVSWLPNAVIPEVDCAEFTLLLDRSIAQRQRAAREAGVGFSGETLKERGEEETGSAGVSSHEKRLAGDSRTHTTTVRGASAESWEGREPKLEDHGEGQLDRQRREEAGERERAEPPLCTHAVRIEAAYTSPFMVCTHDPDQDLMSKILHRGDRCVIMTALQQLCHSGVLVCRAGSTFVEAGAAFGYVSLQMAAAGMKVHAIEPQAANADLIRAGLASNERELGRSMDLVVHELGVGPDGERIPLKHVEGNRAATYLCMPGQEFAAGGFSEVPTSTITRLTGGADVHLLVLSCQGCEAEAVADLLAAGTRVENLILLVPPDVEGECGLRSVAAQAARQLSTAGYCLYALELRGSAPTALSPISDLDAWLAAPLCVECEGPYVFASSRCDLHVPDVQREAEAAARPRGYGELARAAWRSAECQEVYAGEQACLNRARTWLGGAGQKVMHQTCVLEDLAEGGREFARTDLEARPVLLASEVTVVHEYKFVYVCVRKAASSAIHTILDEVFGVDVYAGSSCPNNTSREHLIYRCTTLALTEEVLRDYFFFTYVRDPLARFYSGVVQLAENQDAGFVLDRVNGPEQLAALLYDMQRLSFIPNDHLETQAFVLSSPVLVAGRVEMVDFDWIEWSERLGQSFPRLLDRIEAHAGKHIPAALRARSEALAAEFKNVQAASRYSEMVKSWRTDWLDQLVRETYKQDFACFALERPT